MGGQGVSLLTCTFLCASASSSLWSGSHVFSFLSLVILSRSCFGYREKLPFTPMWYFPDGFIQDSGICLGQGGKIVSVSEVKLRNEKVQRLSGEAQVATDCHPWYLYHTVSKREHIMIHTNVTLSTTKSRDSKNHKTTSKSIHHS